MRPFQRGGDTKPFENFLPFRTFDHSGRAEAEDENDGEGAEEGGDDLEAFEEVRRRMRPV